MNRIFAPMYELWSSAYINFENFSNNLYDSNVYVTVGILMVLTSLMLEAIYYYALSNYGNLYKTRFWFVWLLLILVMNFSTAYFYSTTEMAKLPWGSNGCPYTFTQYFTFSMVNVLWALIFSFVFSLILKIKSVRASRTPF